MRKSVALRPQIAARTLIISMTLLLHGKQRDSPFDQGGLNKTKATLFIYLKHFESICLRKMNKQVKMNIDVINNFKIITFLMSEFNLWNLHT